ncbi:MAG: DUF86 domain-containing protein [Anaerolineae bacterium]|nr:DUF86 domain-containing protein [Anaerolineae bacterium]
MVKPKTLASILNNLRNYQNKLSILADYPREEFIQDFTKVESAKHLFRFLSNVVWILPDSFMPTLRQMVSFRNRVVHVYWDVDDSLLYDILQQNLHDFETFVSYILNFTDKQITN